MPTIAPTLARQIRATRRFLRRQNRGKTGPSRERRRVALGGLTELEGDPLRRCGEMTLAVQAAINVRRAQAAA